MQPSVYQSMLHFGIVREFGELCVYCMQLVKKQGALLWSCARGGICANHDSNEMDHCYKQLLAYDQISTSDQ